jgi:hypothetical protein
MANLFAPTPINPPLPLHTHFIPASHHPYNLNSKNNNLKPRSDK